MSERLIIDYRLHPAPGESPSAKAEGIALEQTVELAAERVDAALLERIAGRVESLDEGDGFWCTRISYPLAAVGTELTQLLNLLFGNISLKSGIRIDNIHWPQALLNALGGPRYGIEGLRELAGVPRRPLLCTALKPMGSSAEAFADIAYRFALGGIDLIKDDHGVADQPDAPFRERIDACARAVAKANSETGGNSLYLPNITAGYDQLPRRLEAAAAAGCRAVLINPWATGLDAMRWARDRFALAMMAHPSLTGAYFRPDHGLLPELVLGDLFRLAGADASIYPNTGGRFGFSRATCETINIRLRTPFPGIRPAFPAPGGGMDVARAGYWIEQYGPDTILLIGGSLYAQNDITEAARTLRAVAEGD